MDAVVSNGTFADHNLEEDVLTEILKTIPELKQLQI